MSKTDQSPAAAEETKAYGIQLDTAGPRIFGTFDAPNIKSAFKEFHDYLLKYHPTIYKLIRRTDWIGTCTVTVGATDHLYQIVGTERWGSGGRTLLFRPVNKKRFHA